MDKNQYIQTLSKINGIWNKIIPKINISQVNKILKLEKLKEILVQVKVKKEQKLDLKEFLKDLKEFLKDKDKPKDNKIATVSKQPNRLKQFIIGTELFFKLLISIHIVILCLNFFYKH